MKCVLLCSLVVLCLVGYGYSHETEAEADHIIWRAVWACRKALAPHNGNIFPLVKLRHHFDCNTLCKCIGGSCAASLTVFPLQEPDVINCNSEHGNVCCCRVRH